MNIKEQNVTECMLSIRCRRCVQGNSDMDKPCCLCSVASLPNDPRTGAVLPLMSGFKAVHRRGPATDTDPAGIGWCGLDTGTVPAEHAAHKLALYRESVRLCRWDTSLPLSDEAQHHQEQVNQAVHASPWLWNETAPPVNLPWLKYLTWN